MHYIFLLVMLTLFLKTNKKNDVEVIISTMLIVPQTDTLY